MLAPLSGHVLLVRDIHRLEAAMLLLQQTACASILGVHMAASCSQQRLVPTVRLEIARSGFRPFLFAAHDVVLEEDIVALLTETRACVSLFVARNSVLFR